MSRYLRWIRHDAPGWTERLRRMWADRNSRLVFKGSPSGLGFAGAGTFAGPLALLREAERRCEVGQ